MKNFIILNLYTIGHLKRVRDAILKRGIKRSDDENELVCLTEKPFYETLKGIRKESGFLFKVKIPNNNLLYYWEDFWTDDNGEEFDSDHHADPKNQYYIYMGDIPLKYVEEVV